MFCKYCGQPQDDDALFCSACGKKISAEKTQNKPLNPDINTFTAIISDGNQITENEAVFEEIDTTHSTPVENKYTEIEESPELSKENLTQLWIDTNNGTKLLLLAGAVMIIALFAILMLNLFFPDIRL